MDGLFILSAVLALLGMGYYSAPLWVWTITAAAVLALMTLFLGWPLWIWVVPWLVLAAFAILFHLPVYRRSFISRNLLNFVKKQLPPLSETERAALESGDTFWDAALFQGLVRWQPIKSFQIKQLTEEERYFLDNTVEELCQKIDTWKDSHAGAHSQAIWEQLKQARFLGMLIPKKYGGLEFSAYAQSCVVSKIASKDMSTAVTVMVPNSLGPAELLLHYGTEAQKNYYLPRLASGDEIPCFGLTGPEAGSDAGSMQDFGIIEEADFEGKKTLGIRLSFNKRYITLAPVATVVGLAFKCYDPDGFLGAQKELGITVCLLPAKHHGVKIGNRHYPIGSHFANGTIAGENVFIPLEWVVGGPQMIGQGWRMLMECLAAGRGISLPALSTASAQLAYVSTSAYASVRRQFKCLIGQFEGIQAGLARIGGLTYLLESMRSITASAVAQGIKPAVVSAIAKYHMTESARVAINDAMDIHAGRGVILGPSNYLANTYSIMPMAITVEGANILTRNLIVFGQGAIRCHPFLLQEMELAQSKTENIPAFDAILMKHLKYTFERFFKTFVFALTGGQGVAVSPEMGLIKYQKQLSRMSVALSFVSDMAFLCLGGQLKRKEFLSARLGDVLSYLYIGTSIIKYYHHTGLKNTANAQWALAYCLHQIQEAFMGFFDNFPIRALGQFLKFWVFPLGRSYRAPSDSLTQRLAKNMLKDSLEEASFLQTFFWGEHGTLRAVINAHEIQNKHADVIQMIWKSVASAKEQQTATFLTQLEKLYQEKKIDEKIYPELKKYIGFYETAIAVDSFEKGAE